jgi:predicted phosphodiesterase
MGAPAYRVAPLVLVLAVVAIALAMADGWFSGEDSGTTANGNPVVGSDTRKSALVWAVGDSADGGSASREIARMITSSKPDRVLYLGDVYNEGTAEEFAQNFDPLFGKIAKRVAPTPGNHEWPLHGEGYDPYWLKKRGRPIAHRYSFRTAGWQILSLNSEMDHDSDSEQVKWLRSRVKGGATCRLAFWHRPRYSAGTHHGDQPDVEPFWAALKGRAAIVIGGHEHDLQRFKRRDGITQFVSGAGGRARHSVRPRADLAFASDDRFGALRLRLSRGLARYRFVAMGGATLDSGKLRCRPG